MRLTLKHRVLNAKERKGWHSFFVEIYDNGTRVYEPLNMVADPKDKAKYRAARQFCQDVIAKRQIELSSIAAGLKPSSTRYRKGDFIQYCRGVAKKVRNEKTRENWECAISTLARIEPEGLEFGEIDKHWLEDFQVLPHTEGEGDNGTLIVTSETALGGISSQDIEELIRSVILCGGVN
jgi:hypothetical protein